MRNYPELTIDFVFPQDEPPFYRIISMEQHGCILGALSDIFEKEPNVVDLVTNIYVRPISTFNEPDYIKLNVSMGFCDLSGQKFESEQISIFVEANPKGDSTREKVAKEFSNLIVRSIENMDKKYLRSSAKFQEVVLKLSS